MDEELMSIIESGLDTVESELLTSYSPDSDYFKRLSFTKWALKELRDFINSRPEESPCALTEEFMQLMDHYSTEQFASSYPFSVAYDTAWELIAEVLN